ncbi:MAG: hypothetical protein J2P37_09885 [Ktedonobacteraceae bacterium]|nr:hypothetical protein [Ktedonobacteraceae bacterium]MBO0792310.1 hypothetical protein [Ktedonobacteraceae bacterium]
MSQVATQYHLVAEVKIRREAFGGILYKYGCADRGALSFVNSPPLIELLITSQQRYHGHVNAALENRGYSEAAQQKLFNVFADLARRGYLEVRE